MVVPPTKPPSLFTPTEWRVVEYLVRGLTPVEITAELKRSIITTHRHLRYLRYKTHCPTRCPLPVLVHRLLTSYQATAPATDLPVPDLAPDEVSLLRALAEESTPVGRATATGLSPTAAASALNALLGRTGAANATQLVALAHTWKLLPNKQDRTGRNGAAQ
ncbi:DNA-binding protein [Streptomyces sp. V17-9]|uniref:helix-turn-helix transcriptional regulator n=1 Tax=unclassified Streptomyces TaxID=2593676 RepID=UPI001BAF6EBA|nr:DNA-binding protein [Streptomyces sp. V17-9]